MATAPLKSVTLNYLQLQPEGDSTGLPQVVLIHGLAANLSFWYFSIAPLLAEVAQVTLLDLRGHGRSTMPPSGYQLTNMAEDIAQLLSYLKIDRPHLIGHSLGGSVMAHFASRYPQKPASLTFADVRLKLFQPAMTLADWPQWKTYQALLDDLGIALDPNSHELGYQLLLEMARLHLRNPRIQRSATVGFTKLTVCWVCLCWQRRQASGAATARFA
ncbi:MAG: alpha/beta hydrolase [Phormidesmis sp. RL_2_1]|nr:alpha/beta hydrolase [Phormidesmis sp. RL_2_1]